MDAIKRTEAHRRDGLFARRWTPEEASVAVVVLVHGIGEHSGRYDNVGVHFAAAGYELCAFDLRGHGRTEGKRGHLRFDDAFDDLDRVLADERAAAPGKPLFLYGHSLGGLIVLDYALRRRPAVTGLVASGAALHTFAARESPMKMWIARHFGALLPRVTVPSGLDAAKLTRDEVEMAEYLADPLIHTRASLGLGRDVQLAIEHVLANAGALSVPLLLVHGGNDQLNLVTGSQAVAAALGDRCELKVYDDILHKPHKDPDAPRVLGDVVAWMERHRRT